MSQNTLPPISIRVDDSVAEKLSSMAEERGISRSQLISRALTAFTKSTECIRCGALNAEGSMFCSVCGLPLYSDEEIKRAIVDSCLSRPRIKEILTELENSGLVPSIEGDIDRTSAGDGANTLPYYSGVLKVRTKSGLSLKLEDMEVEQDIPGLLRVDAGALADTLSKIREKDGRSPCERMGKIEADWDDDYEHNKRTCDEMKAMANEFRVFMNRHSEQYPKPGAP